MMSRAAIVLILLAAMRFAVADPTPDAEQLYRDGQTAYDQQHYDDALAAWQRSYELSHAPALLFNIAQAYRLRAHPGDCVQARTQYQSFIQVAEPSQQRSLAEQYVAELASCANSPAGVAPAPSDDASTNEHSIRNRQIAVVAIGGSGAVLLATGIYFGHRASTLGDEVTSACASVSSPCDWSVQSGKDAAGHRDATLGWTFDALGAAALVGSAALYWFGIHESEIQVARVATRPRESGAVLSWSSTW